MPTTGTAYGCTPPRVPWSGPVVVVDDTDRARSDDVGGLLREGEEPRWTSATNGAVTPAESVAAQPAAAEPVAMGRSRAVASPFGLNVIEMAWSLCEVPSTVRTGGAASGSRPSGR